MQNQAWSPPTVRNGRNVQCLCSRFLLYFILHASNSFLPKPISDFLHPAAGRPLGSTRGGTAGRWEHGARRLARSGTSSRVACGALSFGGSRSVHAPFRLFCVGGAQPGRKGDGAVLPRICPGIPLYKRRHKVKTSQSRVSGWTRGSDVLIYGILIYIVIYGRRKSFCPCGAGGRAMHNAEAALQLLRRFGSVVEGFVHLRSTDLFEHVRSDAANRTGVIRRQFSALVHIATDLAAPLRGGRCRLLLRRDRCAG